MSMIDGRYVDECDNNDNHCNDHNGGSEVDCTNGSNISN